MNTTDLAVMSWASRVVSEKEPIQRAMTKPGHAPEDTQFITALAVIHGVPYTYDGKTITTALCGVIFDGSKWVVGVRA